ncbi:ABC transporter substrate-binding protein [Pseudonocardia sp. HH130630-07]|uniref:ABC transporter substrate-binding protein n=1 Tax=Pseudonocardia sp. HH130630-07 TaxID=1690815 RepID=UPI000814D55C|nr:extracellular solute-binding protein [Pseudonocardia sp. HH130630-07]ANY09078.1 sugar ABC transporter substrate-binding protein [Pseudonocardia sp. HH130630-07]
MNERVRVRAVRTICSAAVMAIALVVTSCSTGGSGGAADGPVTGPITLQTWALTPTYTEYLNGVIAEFEAAHPGTDVTLLDQPGEGYPVKLLSQASSGSLPDVVNLDPELALPLAKRDLLQPLDEEALTGTYVGGAVDAFRFRGTDGVFAYPWYLNTDINYWNRDMFQRCGLNADAPPSTTDELFTQAARMAEACPDTYLMSRKPTITDFSRAGVEILDPAGEQYVFADAPEAVALVERYAAAYRDGLMPPSVLNSDYLGNSELFTQSKVAWTTGGASALADIERDNPSLKGRIAVSPALDTPPLYVQGLAVSANSANPATAQEFARFMTDAQNQEAFAREVNIFPSTLSSSGNPYFSTEDGSVGSKARVLANTALGSARVLDPPEANLAMRTFLDQQVAQAMRGDKPAGDALREAQDRMNAMLADS